MSLMLREDILLFGTGRSALPPPQWLRPYLNSLGIQLDTMDSVSTLIWPLLIYLTCLSA